MRVVMFCHSLLSDWNHGNAHFLRGIVSELTARGHEVRVFEPEDAWSLRNLVTDHGTEAIERFHRAYPQLGATRYNLETLDLDEAQDGADLVLVHEWNDPALVERIGRYRIGSGRSMLLFHDTHHRSVTDPQSMSRYDLDGYDGVLAFGDSVAEVYRRRGWARNVWTWHEAADTRMFRPMEACKQGDLVWIGNWGDGERTSELYEFLIEPAKALQLRSKICGVRYPEEGLRALKDARIEYGGWIPNFEVPDLLARHRMTVHVPRRPYATALPGVPTIRMFEALACGIPLISAPWSDSEGLFTPGEEFLVARNGEEMKAHMRTLLEDDSFAREIAHNGLEAILARHTCAHRVHELSSIYHSLKNPVAGSPVGGRIH